MLRHAAICSLLMALCVILPVRTTLAADTKIVRTGHGVYQSSTLREKVVISYEVPGIFVALGDPIPLQRFSPLDLESESTRHLFVRFDASLNRYTSIIANGTEELALKDNVSIEIGENLRVGIDNTIPYLSIVVAPSKQKVRPAILGMVGLDPLATRTGEDSIRLLDATGDPRYSDVLEPYDLRADGLYLTGDKVVQGPLGLSFGSTSNVCLKPSSVLMSEAERRKISAVKDRQRRLSLLQQILKRPDSSDLLDRLFSVRVMPRLVVAFDTEAEKLVTMEPIDTFGAGTPQVCVVRNAFE